MRSREACRPALPAWTDSGLVLTQPSGAPLVPFSVSQAFSRLVRSYGMPPLT